MTLIKHLSSKSLYDAAKYELHSIYVILSIIVHGKNEN